MGWEIELDSVESCIVRAPIAVPRADGVQGSSQTYVIHPRIIIRVFKLSSAQATTSEQLIQSCVAPVGQRLNEPELSLWMVDGLAAYGLVQHRRDADGQAALHFQVFIQADQVICSITGVGDVTQSATLLPIFEHATGSIRFIPVNRGSRDVTTA